jgi:SagB-type dehydrogenase family enzyme
MLHRHAVVAAGFLLATGVSACASSPQLTPRSEAFDLPPVPREGAVSVEEALQQRRSTREFGAAAVDLATIGRLLWAAQGATQEGGAGRSAPSAGGTYPLEVYAVLGDGLLHYVPRGHRAEWIDRADLRDVLYRAALEQTAVRDAPVVLVITALPARTEERYGDRAERYVFLEAGHAAQNVLLQATALGLAAVPVGAFTDDEVASALQLGAGEVPVYLIPIGHPPG